jgi:hypothetical protein
VFLLLFSCPWTMAFYLNAKNHCRVLTVPAHFPLRLDKNPVPKRLARLLQTPLRRRRACALLSRPLHPSRRHPNHRLVSFTDDQVTFRWRDSAHHNEHKLMTLSLDEFLRRFLLHMLPKGFVRIRHFGFLANRRRTALLPLCYRLLHAEQPSQSELEASPAKQPNPLWRCPKCGGPMVVLERLTAAQIQLRSPPFLTGATA